MTRKATLVYADSRGIGEPIRLLLELGGWAWDMHVAQSREEFQQLKLETLHGTVPFLRVHREDGPARILEQAPAILAWLARDAGLFPADEPARYHTEMLMALFKDVAWTVVTVYFQPDKEAAVTALRETVAPRFFPSIQRVLKVWGDGERCLVGEDFSLADVLAFDVLTNYEDWHPGHLGEAYPELDALMRHVGAHPTIAAYMASPRRHGLPDDGFKERVMRVMG